MNREEYIKSKISEKGFSIKSFAQQIGMPYSTLLSMLNGSIGGASVDNVIKICNGLDITINDLQSVSTDFPKLTLSEQEKQLVLAYRKQPEMQVAVNRLLGISHVSGLIEFPEEEKIIYRAAMSFDNHEHQIEKRSKNDIAKFASAEKVTSEEDL